MLDARTNPHSQSTRARRSRARIGSLLAAAVAAPLAIAIPATGEVAARSPARSTASAAPLAADAPSSIAHPEATRTQAQRVVQLVNRRRRNNGRRALDIAPRVTRAAIRQSRHQANIDTMTHRGPWGGNAGHRLRAEGYPWGRWGEAVARGYRRPANLVRAWMNSPGHRQILLMRRVPHIGVARSTSNDGTIYWTLVIARRP